MATTDRFSAMLRSYAPNKLLREEIVEADWFLKNVERDDTWLGGELEVRFQGAKASSVKFGSLTDETDIAQSTYVKGSITEQPEIWGSLVFNEKDLMRNGKISEQNFLKLLPGEIEDFTRFMSMALSLSFTNGPKYAEATAAGTAGGVVAVDRVERFEIDQKVFVAANVAAYYVIAIDVNGDTITLSDTRGGAAADVSAEIADGDAIYLDGAQTAANRLTSMRDSLLSAANGGSTSLYGQTKTAYPYLQAVNVDGSDITSTNILAKLFDKAQTIRRKGKGNPTVAVLSHTRLGQILGVLETQKGAYRQADALKASLYNWSEVTVGGPKGSLKIVGIQEMQDDVIMVLDMAALTTYSNGFIKKRVSPDGQLYHVIRASTGYKYIVDMCFFGDMVLERPSRCGIIHSIP